MCCDGIWKKRKKINSQEVQIEYHNKLWRSNIAHCSDALGNLISCACVCVSYIHAYNIYHNVRWLYTTPPKGFSRIIITLNNTTNVGVHIVVDLWARERSRSATCSSTGALFWRCYARGVLYTIDVPIFMSWMTWPNHFTWIIITCIPLPLCPSIHSILFSVHIHVLYSYSYFNVFLMCIRHLAPKWITYTAAALRSSAV